MNELTIVDTGDPDGSPLVWLGSLGSSTAMWQPQVADFGADRRCLLIDHPGHGTSPPASGPLSIDALSDDVAAALGNIGVECADIVGLSLGAMVAMNLAARHPDRVGRLALMCTTAVAGAPDVWAERAAAVRTGGMKAIVDAVVERWLTPPYADSHPDDVDTFRAMVMATDPESYARCCEAIAVMDQRDLLPTVRASTLVVAGTLDPATPPVQGETIAALIPDAWMETVEGAHISSWEQADEVNQFLRDHLQGGDGGG